MKNIILTFMLVISSIVMADANKPLSAHDLSLPATFTGVVNHTQGDTTSWILNIWPDQTFQYNQTINDNPEKSRTISGYGRWYSNPSKQWLVFDHGREKPLYFKVKNTRQLIWVDPDKPDNKGTLKANDEMQSLELHDLMLSGMMVYMADSASITLCQGNSRFPIATEGDYLAMERAYLTDRSAPGKPLFVMFQGKLAKREAIEGPARQMAIVDKFLRTEPEKTCERQMANATLYNTYWRIDEILGTTITPDDSFRREPHLLMQEKDSHYSVTVGCNLMRSNVSVDTDKITFKPAASTMMACPQPIDKYEQDISKALARTARFAINGDTLSLLSADGTILVSLKATYF